jgi:heme exporter protein D
MNWGSASEFFSMGGYGLYVWGSYGMAALLMVAEPLLAARRHRSALRDAAGAAIWDEAAPASSPAGAEVQRVGR